MSCILSVRIPILNLHGTVLIELFMHLERLPQQMRFMAPPFFQTFVFGPLEIVEQDGLVIWMRTFVDHDTCTLSR